ncbi:hypothetical protein [Sedimentisphaera salicampi]|uniref:ICEA Protein n=1 Tax=Sedimentisphaera salicampi TaxID=1941349 RepID=A0A1W6LLN7_9BACT|nr:hypothetical protein [Sedimentisphaera salicampi]ARN56654.1 ICEA Protein [Sedimentisphaera salicampi]
MKNPFREGTISHDDFKTMSDLRWHCSKCELQSGQAKTWQVWRQEKGIQLDTDGKGNFYKRMYCASCEAQTFHRKLKSLEILEVNKARYGIRSKLAKRIKQLYNFEEAVLLRRLSERELEIDHKFPQVRWAKNEECFDEYSDEELKDNFILLSRSNNLWKSRHCENCLKTGKRGHFPGIKYWYKGGEEWKGKTENDPAGCIGCFWYNPYKWRESLQKLIDKSS